MGNLPADLPAPPSFQTTNPNTQPIVYITMATDTLTMGDLYDYANNMVAQRMMMLEGVSNAQVYGSPRSLHPDRRQRIVLPRLDRARRG
jgi:hydrophobic/amphiphilic exporter-1 (mainly G- bacteria), HAE1 family